MGRYGTWELSSKSNLEFESLGYVRYVNAELSLMTSSASGSRPTRRSERIARQIAVTNPTHISPTLATMSDSSLASVVLVDLGKKWVKVTDKEALAPFHTKFWGKSMEDEEAEWRKEPRQIEGPGDEDEDEGRHEGKGKGRAIDEGEDEVMDTDEDEPETDADELEGEATDEDQDVIPGCYPFNVGIEDITVWIRADYIRVFEGLQRSFEKAMKQRGRTPSAVITGQPGVGEFPYLRFLCLQLNTAHQGKSFWIYYAARRLLAEKRTFIWFYKARYYLFVQEGVYKLPSDWEHDDFRYIMWTLVDSDQSKAGVPEVLVPQGTRLFAIYVSSPAADRWSRLHKTTRPIRIIMNPWSRRSIIRVWVYFSTSPYSFF